MDQPTWRQGSNYVLSRDLTPKLVPVDDCKPLGRETRKHPPQQIRKLAASLERFGFVLPIVLDVRQRVVAGWGLVLAARQLGLGEVPAVSLTDLSDADLRVLRLALNRIADDADWDREALALEFSDILELDPDADLTLSGFAMGEIDVALDGDGRDEEDDLPIVDEQVVPVTRPDDLWILGDHRLLCGNALEADSYDRLLRADKVDMMFADPPYNLKIEGHVSGLGTVKHADFAMASGELTSAEFEGFLKTALDHAANRSVDGAIHYVCIDWRHQREMLAAGQVYGELKALCIWAKSNAGMGSLYRSQHELIFVFKVGKGAHVNNIALGRYGRHRSNVWDYVGQNALSGTGKSKLGLHPTVKPVAMIADAMRDCSNRGGLILDPFGGAGTTLIAAERTGRRARVIELNPVYVDVSIGRWERFSGGTAINADSGLPFTRIPSASTTGTGK
jgi:DNA modification methylase